MHCDDCGHIQTHAADGPRPSAGGGSAHSPCPDRIDRLLSSPKPGDPGVSDAHHWHRLTDYPTLLVVANAPIRRSGHDDLVVASSRALPGPSAGEPGRNEEVSHLSQHHC